MNVVCVVIQVTFVYVNIIFVLGRKNNNIIELPGIF